LAYRIALIPVIGALSYEIMRFSGKNKTSKFVNILMYPGLALQYLTTKEPTDDMILVAINALHALNEVMGYQIV
jgi:uncharacterized protein YqhQ